MGVTSLRGWEKERLGYLLPPLLLLGCELVVASFFFLKTWFLPVTSWAETGLSQ